jgi:predicted DNA-binding protein (MmcQ/YjbR family)
MNREAFDEFCATLPAATHVIQWGNASAWKLGGKLFAVCSGWGEGKDESEPEKICFKCTDMSYELLCGLKGVIPAPYLARAKFVQVLADNELGDEDMRAYIVQAHSIIAGKLTKTMRAELGLA